MILFLLINLWNLDPLPNNRDFVVDLTYSSVEQVQTMNQAIYDLNMAVGCIIVSMHKVVKEPVGKYNLITMSPFVMNKEKSYDIGMTYDLRRFVKIAMRYRIQNEELYFVFIHELGHSLGLDHTKVETDVMSEYYDSDKINSEVAPSFEHRKLWAKQVAKSLKKLHGPFCNTND